MTETSTLLVSLAGEPPTGPLERLMGALAAALGRVGASVGSDGAAEANFVLNAIDREAPKPFRRRSRGTFVAAVHERDAMPADIEESLKLEYPMLVRALANIVLCYVPGTGVTFTTMERGHYLVPEDGDTDAMADRVVERLMPLATSRLVIDNEFRTDLEQELWNGDEVTAEIYEAGRRLGALDLLPSPFPIEELLSERELRHVKRLYSIGGLSYGNLSMRKDETRFWMSASGVDKANLREPSRDVLLVSGYVPEAAKMVLSVAPEVEPRRVSVDAIEHWMIYRNHPDVGAILHVHAWVEGVPATDVNYPCGTAELARAVSGIIDAAPEPTRAIVGLRNHGITATGDSLLEIIDRITPGLLRQVPMT
ncbi:MAG TPA: class II aldolase/adducin family protein [Gaiellaceae bacterium]|nr:class II aldolase/adducin family protein [Gaiellaceae bacterium]